MKQPSTYGIKFRSYTHDKTIRNYSIKFVGWTIISCTVRHHRGQGSHQTTKSWVVLINKHVLLLNNMSLLHKSVQKSTTVLNIATLQAWPDSLGCFTLGQTHNHRLLSTVNHGSHHLAIISLQVLTSAALLRSCWSAGGSSVRWKRSPWPLKAVSTQNAHSG